MICQWLKKMLKFIVYFSFRFFKYVLIVFSKSDDYLIFIFVHQKSRKLAFKTGLSVQNIHFYWCGLIENTKWILCSRKIGVKCAYSRYLIYTNATLF